MKRLFFALMISAVALTAQAAKPAKVHHQPPVHHAAVKPVPFHYHHWHVYRDFAYRWGGYYAPVWNAIPSYTWDAKTGQWVVRDRAGRIVYQTPANTAPSTGL